MPVPSFSHKKQVVALFPKLLGVGGVQQAGRMTAEALCGIASSHGWTIELLTLNDTRGIHHLPQNVGIQFRGFARNKLAFVAVALSKAMAVKTGGFVLAGHPNLAPLAAGMKRMRPSLHTIVMTHGIDVWEPLSSSRKKALQAADLVVAPSTFTASKLADIQHIAESKIVRLPWPVSSSLLEMAQRASKLPKPPNFPAGKIVLTVGRWAADEKYKGADHLIRAVANLRSSTPDVQLVLVGSGDDLPRLRSLAADLKLSDRVHFLQSLSDEQVAACYAHADVFALPSTGEGFGLVFLEAMAFGKPIVGAAAGGVTDIIRDGDNGFLVSPDNPEQLSQTLEKPLRDSSLRAKLGLRGAEIVKRDYAFDTFRANLLQVLDESAKPKGRA